MPRVPKGQKRNSGLALATAMMRAYEVSLLGADLGPGGGLGPGKDPVDVLVLYDPPGYAVRFMSQASADDRANAVAIVSAMRAVPEEHRGAF